MAEPKLNFMTESFPEPGSKRRGSVYVAKKVISGLESAVRVANLEKQRGSGRSCNLHEIEDTAVINQVRKKSVGQKIINELQDLKDGWSGPESVALAKIILNEAEKLVNVLNIESRKNLRVWVDDEGSVTFYWKLKNRDILSIDLYGDGRAHCTFTPRNNKPSVLSNIEFSDATSLRKFVFSRIK